MSIGLVRLGAGLALLYAARRYYRNWNTTKAECSSTLPGDELVGRPAVQSTEGVWIDAPASIVWACLAEMSDEGRLAPGVVVRLAPKGWLGRHDGLSMSVVSVNDGEDVVLRGSPPAFPWDAVWSFHVQPHWEDRCRLLARSRARLMHPRNVVFSELAGPMTALAVRRLLLDIKRKAQESSAAADDVTARAQQ